MALELVAELPRPCVDEVAIEVVVAVHPETRSVGALLALAQNDECGRAPPRVRRKRHSSHAVPRNEPQFFHFGMSDAA
jgi:hypothetical protein